MIELLVVISLIVILATMGMGMYKTSVIHAREATLKEDLFRIRDAIDQYYADKGQYPAALDSLGNAASHVGGPAELLAADLREALDSMGDVLGRVTPDES